MVPCCFALALSIGSIARDVEFQNHAVVHQPVDGCCRRQGSDRAPHRPLQSGDRLLVSELSRLGRSLGQVLQIVATLIERKIRFIAIKEAIEVEGKQDLRTKVMIAMFG